MPFGDRTGPMGMGPMTGRAAGYCAGYPVPGFMNPIPGRGFWGRGFWGWGRGWGGRGWRHWYWATGLPGWARWGAYAPPYAAAPVAPAAYDPAQEREFLQAQAEGLRQGLQAIEKRLQELQKEVREKGK